jgi:hypothetical protein
VSLNIYSSVPYKNIYYKKKKRKSFLRLSTSILLLGRVHDVMGWDRKSEVSVEYQGFLTQIIFILYSREGDRLLS